MNRDRTDLERMLGIAIDTSYPVLVHVYRAEGDADYEVVYAAIEMGQNDPNELQRAAGLLAPGDDSYAAAILPSGWNVEPGDPPRWWPNDPASLARQAARQLDGGWIVAGAERETLFLLVTRTGS